VGRLEDLKTHLGNWTDGDAKRRQMADTLLAMADASIALARQIARAPIANPSAQEGNNGIDKGALIDVANELFAKALDASPVAVMACEIDNDKPADTINVEGMAKVLKKNAPLAVLINPLAGGSNIAVNSSTGTIFSILPADGGKGDDVASALVQSGKNLLAAGSIVYGPQTTLTLSVGQGTSVFTFDPDRSSYVLSAGDVSIPVCKKEYAINASNYHHWDAPIQAYIDDCIEEDPATKEIKFDMRWVASLGVEAHRIIIRGGVYLSPRDGRTGYINGRQRLAFEANPIAFLVSQANGRATDGTHDILDIEATKLSQQTPLIFGSRQIVERVIDYHTDRNSMNSRAPLFAQRGLFRT